MARSSAFITRWTMSTSRKDIQAIDKLVDSGEFSSRSHFFKRAMKLWFNVHRPEEEIEGI